MLFGPDSVTTSRVSFRLCARAPGMGPTDASPTIAVMSATHASFVHLIGRVSWVMLGCPDRIAEPEAIVVPPMSRKEISAFARYNRSPVLARCAGVIAGC